MNLNTIHPAVDPHSDQLKKNRTQNIRVKNISYLFKILTERIKVTDFQVKNVRVKKKDTGCTVHKIKKIKSEITVYPFNLLISEEALGIRSPIW